MGATVQGCVYLEKKRPKKITGAMYKPAAPRSSTDRRYSPVVIDRQVAAPFFLIGPITLVSIPRRPKTLQTNRHRFR